MHYKPLEAGMKAFWYCWGSWFHVEVVGMLTGSTARIRVKDTNIPGSRPYDSELDVYKGFVVTLWDLQKGDTIVGTHKLVAGQKMLVTEVDHLSDRPRYKFKCVVNGGNCEFTALPHSGNEWDIATHSPLTMQGWPKHPELNRPNPIGSQAKEGKPINKWKGTQFQHGDVAMDVRTRQIGVVLDVRDNAKSGREYLVLRAKAKVSEDHDDLDGNFPQWGQSWVNTVYLNPGEINGRIRYAGIEDIKKHFPYLQRMNDGSEYYMEKGTIVWVGDTELQAESSWNAQAHEAQKAREERERKDRREWLEKQYQQGAVLKQRPDLHITQWKYPVSPDEAFIRTYQVAVDPYAQTEFDNGVSAIDPVPVPKLVSLDDSITILNPLI